MPRRTKLPARGFMVPLSFVEKFVGKPIRDAILASEEIPFRADEFKEWHTMRQRLGDVLAALEETKKLAEFCGPREFP